MNSQLDAQPRASLLTNIKRLLLVLLLGTLGAGELVAEDGYRLWQRYDRFLWKKVRESFSEHVQAVVLQTPTGLSSEVLAAAEAELIRGMDGMIDHKPRVYLIAGEEFPELKTDALPLKKSPSTAAWACG